MRRFLAAGCLLLAAGCANLLGMGSAGAQLLQPRRSDPTAVTSEVIALLKQDLAAGRLLGEIQATYGITRQADKKRLAEWMARQHKIDPSYR